MSAAVPESGVHLISSLAQTHSHDRGGHVVQLYTDDSFLVEVLSRYIGGAISVGDGAVGVVTQSHHEGLAQRLSRQGLGTAKTIRQGRYRLADARRTLPRLMANAVGDG